MEALEVNKVSVERSPSNWGNRRVLITGATGMIGAWLVKELLDQGAHVVALILDSDPQSELYRSGDIHRVTVVNGSLEDFWTLERAINLWEIDTVFHLGAQTIVNVAHRFPLRTFESNVRGTYNLLEVCRLHRDLVRRIIIASSDKAYGEQATLPYTEEMPLKGQHPYEASKSCADLIAQSYYHTYGLPVAIARCGNVYGGGDLNWNRLVPGTIRSFLKNQSPVIRSDGSYVRDYVYVKDVVQAYVQLAASLEHESVIGEAFNFSTEAPMTVIEMVSTIQELMDCQNISPDIRDCSEGELHSQYLSAEKARNILGWHPSFSLEQGLRETIEWYSDFFSERDWQ